MCRPWRRCSTPAHRREQYRLTTHNVLFNQVQDALNDPDTTPDQLKKARSKVGAKQKHYGKKPIEGLTHLTGALASLAERLDDRIAATIVGAIEAPTGELYPDFTSASRGDLLSHRPDPDGDSMDALGSIMPADAYTDPGLYMQSETPMTRFEIKEALKGVQGNPDAEVTVYRAIPANGTGEIHDGDWVTPSKTYALNHAEMTSSQNGGEQYTVIERRVKASELRSDGNGLTEWGFFATAEEPVESEAVAS